MTTDPQNSTPNAMLAALPLVHVPSHAPGTACSSGAAVCGRPYSSLGWFPAPVKDGRGKKSSVDSSIGSKSDGLRVWPLAFTFATVLDRTGRAAGAGPAKVAAASSSEERDDRVGETEGRRGGF